MSCARLVVSPDITEDNAFALCFSILAWSEICLRLP
jgi:hypothetical protein